MKKMKFAVWLAALAVVFGFSSCLDNDDSNYPAYQASVTVTGDETMGFRLYADNGSILVPTAQSASALKNVRRAVVAFDLIDGMRDQNLVSGQTYHIVLRPEYSQGIPTYNVIDLHNNAPADTLVKNQDPIRDMEGLYVKNGYANVAISFPFDRAKRFYMNVGYDSSVDVDPASNTLTLHVYYDHKSQNPYEQLASLFSFRMPEKEMIQFRTDSINVVLKAKLTDYSAATDKELKCKMAVRDFMVPRY